MESLFAQSEAASSSPPPSSSQPWSSSPSSSSDGVSSPVSDNVLTPNNLPVDQDWEILSDLLINDALSALPLTFAPNSSGNANSTSENTLYGLQSEATPDSPFSGAFPAGYSSSSSLSSAPEAVQMAIKPKGRGRKTAVKELLTVDEQKKQRRRSQIASSVQRHREKKKCLLSSLQTDMARLTAQLATLRAERRAQCADNEQLVAYEEQAMTQRRKRKQAEQTNQELKQALFQQIAFLGGLKVLMGGNDFPCSKTLEFHDWVHSYTALASGDSRARRREYVAHFPSSKMELANQLVLKSTEEETQRMLATGQQYSSSSKLLHDGTREFEQLDESNGDAMMRQFFGNGSKTEDVGDGRVIREFSSVYLFQESPYCTLESLLDVVFTSMRSIGVYYPSQTFESRALEEIDIQEKETKSRVVYSELAMSMSPIMEVVDVGNDTDQIQVEARVLTKEQRSPNEGMILWDYVDEDSLNPPSMDISGRKSIQRIVCGAMVIRREIGTGMLSVRHVSIKGYCPLAKFKNGQFLLSAEAEEARQAVARHVGLQATEFERIRDRCTRYVFDDIANHFASLHVS